MSFLNNDLYIFPVTFPGPGSEGKRAFFIHIYAIF